MEHDFTEKELHFIEFLLNKSLRSFRMMSRTQQVVRANEEKEINTILEKVRKM